MEGEKLVNFPSQISIGKKQLNKPEMKNEIKRRDISYWNAWFVTQYTGTHSITEIQLVDDISMLRYNQAC
jgi:hypothetical protein